MISGCLLLVCLTAVGAESPSSGLCDPWWAAYDGDQASGEQVVALWSFDSAEGTEDDSGNEHHATLTAGTPTLAADQINGLPAVQFDGSEYLAAAGGFFAKDEPLLRLDPRDYEAALARARADVARASGEAEHAAAELRRQQGLARSKANSPSQLSNARRGQRHRGTLFLRGARSARRSGDRQRRRFSRRLPAPARCCAQHQAAHRAGP